MLVPVIKQCFRNPNISITVLGLTTAAAVLEQQGIPHIGFKDLLLSTEKRALDMGEQLACDLAVSKCNWDESVAYLGLSYVDLEENHGKEEAERLYQLNQRQAFLPLSTLRRLFKQIKPDLVIATNSPRAEQAAILVAGELGVPSLCLVDLLARTEIAWIGQAAYATKLCVLNDYVKDYFIKAGRCDDEIEVTGNPCFDRLADPSLIEKGLQYRLKKGLG